MGLYLGKEKISNVASVVTQNADSMATEIQNHIANNDIHITAAERTKWDAVTKMQNHITDTDIHITADERTKWNTAADNTEDFASTGVMDTNLNINNNAIINVNKINFNDYLNTSDGSTTFYTKLTKTQTINDVLTQAGIGTQYNGDYVLSFYGNDAYPPALIQYIRANGGSSPTVMLNNIADPATDYDAANKHYVDSKALPTASTADNGKVLSVVNGAWAAATMSSGVYVGSYTGDGSTSKTLTFNFKPGFILIFGIYDDSCRQLIGWVNGMSNAVDMQDAYIMSVSQSGNNITFTNYSTSLTISSTSYTYYYVAIPAMN